jgi:hypothetical protein
VSVSKKSHFGGIFKSLEWECVIKNFMFSSHLHWELIQTLVVLETESEGRRNNLERTPVSLIKPAAEEAVVHSFRLLPPPRKEAFESEMSWQLLWAHSLFYCLCCVLRRRLTTHNQMKMRMERPKLSAERSEDVSHTLFWLLLFSSRFIDFAN